MVDTKCRVVAESSLPQDGSQYYYARSAVVASTEKDAVELLKAEMEEDRILLEDVLEISRSDSKIWSDDDEFEINESIEEVIDSNGIALGCFLSEKSMRGR